MTVSEIKKAFDSWKDNDMEVFIHTAGGNHVSIASVKLSKNGKGLDLYPDVYDEEDEDEESDSVYGGLD